MRQFVFISIVALATIAEPAVLQPHHSSPYTWLIRLVRPRIHKQQDELASASSHQQQLLLHQQAVQYATTTTTTTNNDNNATFKRVCYLRMDPRTELQLAQVDGALCTHIVLAFVRVDARGQLVYARASDAEYLAQVPEFKRRYPHCKLMVSVFNEPQYNAFPAMSQSAEMRGSFARSAMQFLTKHQLDGLDLDWEFPNFPSSLLTSREHERVGLTKICEALRSAIVANFFDRQVHEQHAHPQLSSDSTAVALQHSATARTSQSLREQRRQVEPYLLSVAVAGQEAVLSSSYELRQLANLCDWLNVMTYDYYLFKPYAPFAGPNSPLRALTDTYVPILGKLSIEWTINRLVHEDMVARDKLVVGVPTYARAYRLMFRQHGAPSAFALAYGARAGKRVDDYLDYREVCDILDAASVTNVEQAFDERARVPYLLADDGYTWISYENEQSVREKVRYAKQQQLAGYMTWNLNSDDFEGRKMQTTTTTTSSVANGQTSGDKVAPFPLHRAMFAESIS